MEATDRMIEETEGVARSLGRRSAEMTGLANACRAEAADAEQRSMDLRRRADALDDVAEQYALLSRLSTELRDAMDIGTVGVGASVSSALRRVPTVTVVNIGGDHPREPQAGDVVMVQDPVSLDTYRRHEYHPDHGWKRMGPVGS